MEMTPRDRATLFSLAITRTFLPSGQKGPVIGRALLVLFALWQLTTALHSDPVIVAITAFCAWQGGVIGQWVGLEMLKKRDPTVGRVMLFNIVCALLLAKIAGSAYSRYADNPQLEWYQLGSMALGAVQLAIALGYACLFTVADTKARLLYDEPTAG